jgi:molybdate transport system substrate-binding protein
MLSNAMMRRIAFWSTTLILAGLALSSCRTPPGEADVTLKVAGADNFKTVLEQLAQSYTDRQPWVKIELTTANTAKLEDDLKSGGAYDLYIPARAESMMALANQDAINPQSRVPLAINQLVVVAATGSDFRLDVDEMTSPEVRQIAVANPDLLLGHLTREALTSLNYLPNHDAKPLATPDNAAGSTPPATDLPGLPQLPSLATNNLEPKLLVVASEADVVAAVEDGRAQVGITYATYATEDKKVRILSPLPLNSYESVTYNAAIPRNAPHNDEAWQFLNYLRSAEAHAIMQRDGLLVN